MGVGVGVKVGVGLGAGVGVGSGVGAGGTVATGVGTEVGIAVGMAVAVGTAVGVALGIRVGVGVNTTINEPCGLIRVGNGVSVGTGTDVIGVLVKASAGVTFVSAGDGVGGDVGMGAAMVGVADPAHASMPRTTNAVYQTRHDAPLEVIGC